MMKNAECEYAKKLKHDLDVKWKVVERQGGVFLEVKDIESFNAMQNDADNALALLSLKGKTVHAEQFFEENAKFSDEEALQDYVINLLSKHGAYDTSQKPSKDEEIPVMKKRAEQNFEPSGKPDISMHTVPCFLEVKCIPKLKTKKNRKKNSSSTNNAPPINNFDINASSNNNGSIIGREAQILTQCFDRVSNQMEAFGYFYRVVTFGVSERSAWVVVGVRDNEDNLKEPENEDNCEKCEDDKSEVVDTQKQQDQNARGGEGDEEDEEDEVGDFVKKQDANFTIHVGKVNVDFVIGLWKLMRQQRFDGYFVKSEGRAIISTLLKLQLNPAACVVKYFTKSMSKVFKVTILQDTEAKQAPESNKGAPTSSQPASGNLSKPSSSEVVTHIITL
jgi:hypothetical protein